MDEQFLREKIEHCGIKPTPQRLLIYKTMWRGGEMVSLPQLEKLLPFVDKSTISRTLQNFLLHKLIHAVDDGSGAVKYAVCDHEIGDEEADNHIHFYCEQCGRTLCLTNIHVPEVALPTGFKLESINYVLKGICPQCNINTLAH